MDPKINADSQISFVPPGERVILDLEVWDPPFERWMRLADALLGRTVPPLPKGAIPRDSGTLKH